MVLYSRCLLRFGFALCCIVLIAGGCKSRRLAANTGLAKKIPARLIIKNHYKYAPELNSLKGRLKVDFHTAKNSKSFTLSMRIKKDSVMWFSAPLSIIKVMITPKRLRFYNKLDKTWFDGDFEYISNKLGLTLNFNQLQNLLIGQAIYSLNKANYKARVDKNLYELRYDALNAEFRRLFFIDADHFRIKKTQIAEPAKQIELQLEYLSYQRVENKVIPENLVVVAREKDKTATVKMSLKGIDLNENLNFPYRVPEGFSRVLID